MALYIANIVMLGLILVIGSGSDSHGASRWFAISDSFTIQPSEFAKIILIICTAVFLEKHSDDLNTLKTLLKLAAFLALPIGLIFAEPDLSTSSDVATVKDTNLVSEQQTDFIFSAVGEELGFIGSVIIIAILLLIVLQCIRVARRSRNKKGMYIATGMAALVSIQAFINIGVATSILPNTGLPLPFISYGLSSLVSLCAGMGLVLNVNLQKKKY